MSKELFDATARRFDAIYRRESPVATAVNLLFRRAIYQRYEIAMAAAGDVRDRSVLDVGCGSGRYVAEYARRGAQLVVGVDESAAMLELAQELVDHVGIADRCRLVRADFMELPLAERFDVVIAMGVFDYVASPEAFLTRMVRASRGVVVASFPGRSLVRMRLRRWRYRRRGCEVYFYEEADVRRLLAAAGVRDYDLTIIPHSGRGFVVIGRVGSAA